MRILQRPSPNLLSALMEGDSNCGSDNFFEASERFPFPDREKDARQFDVTSDLSQISEIDSVTNKSQGKAIESPLETSPPLSRQGSSVQFTGREGFVYDGMDSSDSSLLSAVYQKGDGDSMRGRRNKFLSALRVPENVQDQAVSPRFRSNSGGISAKVSRNNENSIISDARNELMEKSETVDSSFRDGDISSSNLLVALAGLVIKAILFQISLLISFVTFPIWLTSCSLMLVTHPFRTMRIAKDLFFDSLSRICGYVFSRLCPALYQRFSGRQSFGKYVVEIARGCFWSFYICFVLTGIFVMAFVTSGFVMRWFVQEPVRMKETLNFDYTKASPVAFVPVLSCHGVSACTTQSEKVDVGRLTSSRVIPSNHDLQIDVSFTLPESDYNRRLGIFQIRVDVVSINGKVTGSSSHPCMLRFKSSPIRYMETLLKSGPLIAGYLSESQTVNLRMTQFTEGEEATACLRVILEQRAEFRPGAGIPEIYTASLVLESKLPLFKRIIWKWKNTIFIWLSVWIFVIELLFILVCCRPLILPRAKPRDGPANRT
ncbi:seipin-2-like [Aristolochia californica]|uniref:seipin-2-like n=1 Tax=Aristolochia californica TaxID=171875 RepID=UPI0035DFCABA